MNIKKLLDYLHDLGKNNNREWFQKNKSTYDELRKEFEAFINDMIPEIRKFDKNIGMITAKECVFRIYRDIRFSKDKTPYKTHFGAFIANGGRKTLAPGYYIHLTNDESMIAGGVYMPPPEQFRTPTPVIFYNASDLKAILSDKGFKKYFGGLGDYEKLVRPPKGFPQDFEDIDLLKYKSFTVAHNVSNENLLKEDFFDYTIKVFKAMFTFNTYLYKALEK